LHVDCFGWAEAWSMAEFGSSNIGSGLAWVIVISETVGPWWCPSVPTAVHISCWHLIPTKTSVLHFWRSVCSCCQTTYCGTSCLLCRWRAFETLFLPTSLQHLPYSLSETFKTAPLPTLLSWICPLNSPFTPFVVLVLAVCYSGHVKNFLIDWLIDWLWMLTDWWLMTERCSLASHRRCVWWGSYAAQWWWESAEVGWHLRSFLSRTIHVEVRCMLVLLTVTVTVLTDFSYYFALRGVQSIVMNMSICLFAHVSEKLHSWTSPNFYACYHMRMPVAQEEHLARKKLSDGHCHSLCLAPVNPDWFHLLGFTFLVPAHLGSPGQNPRGP